MSASVQPLQPRSAITATAAEFTPRARRTASESDTADLRTAAMAILDRWTPYAVEVEEERCACSQCVDLRKSRYACECCGYRGEPLVHPCTCTEQHRSFVAQWAATLRRARKGESIVNRHDSEPGRVFTVEELARHVSYLRANPPTSPCQDNQCCHATVECPVCVAAASQRGNWADEANELHPWRIIRDLRDLLKRETAAQQRRTRRARHHESQILNS